MADITDEPVRVDIRKVANWSDADVQAVALLIEIRNLLKELIEQGKQH